jgi:beta-phosphoglucomutase-like phosphatase (HAD superfamily)
VEAFGGRARLGAVGIEPAVLVTADDVSHSKPDPEGYRLTSDRDGLHLR